MARKRLGEILIEQGVLKEAQLKQALDLQKTDRRLIGEILVSKEFVSEEDVVIALAKQLNYRYLPVGNFTVNKEALKRLPSNTAFALTCLPVDLVGNTLMVVMADPSSENALQQIAEASQCQVQAFVGTVSEIENAIGKNYNVPIPSETKSGARLRNVLSQASQQKQLP